MIDMVPHRTLVQKFARYRDRLGIEFVAPFVLAIDGRKLRLDLLLRNFGGPNGMIVVTDYTIIRPFVGRLEHLGYGYSVLPVPRDEILADEEIQSAIDMFSDWGWSGDEAKKPRWLKS